MVSMGPNTLHYNFTNKWRNPCINKSCNDFSTVHQTSINNNIFDVLKTRPDLSKTVSIIKKAHLDTFFNTSLRHTIFVAKDSSIPDTFISTLDSYDSRRFILAYSVSAKISIDELKTNDDTVYQSGLPGTPLLSLVNGNSIIINKVGKVIEEISARNGTIIIMDNIANVL